MRSKSYAVSLRRGLRPLRGLRLAARYPQRRLQANHYQSRLQPFTSIQQTPSCLRRSRRKKPSKCFEDNRVVVQYAEGKGSQALNARGKEVYAIINQDELDERRVQTGLIRRVYWQAHEVPNYIPQLP